MMVYRPVLARSSHGSSGPRLLLVAVDRARLIASLPFRVAFDEQPYLPDVLAALDD
jgi:hypothetical protein